jgi:hypothetical protein
MADQHCDLIVIGSGPKAILYTRGLRLLEGTPIPPSRFDHPLLVSGIFSAIRFCSGSAICH